MRKGLIFIHEKTSGFYRYKLNNFFCQIANVELTSNFVIYSGTNFQK
jgi:hypothetical protein